MPQDNPLALDVLKEFVDKQAQEKSILELVVAAKLDTFNKAKNMTDNFSENLKAVGDKVTELPVQAQQQAEELLSVVGDKASKLSDRAKQHSEAVANKLKGIVHAGEAVPELEKEVAALKSPDLKNLITKALVGGVLGGGIGTAATGEIEGETREQKRKRLIRNALLGVAGGAGLGGLSEVKMGSTKTAFAEAIKNIDLNDPVLLAGLGSAGAAGLLTALRKRKKNETLGQKTLSALGNAALAGGLGAGATALFTTGKENLVHSLPVEDVDATSESLRSPLASAIGGAFGLGLGSKYTANLQPERAEQALKNFVGSLPSGKTKDKLEVLLANKDVGGAKSVLANLFEKSNPKLTTNLRNLSGQFHGNPAEMDKFLRYLNINPSGSMLEGARGGVERFIDARKVQGIGGRFGRIGAGATGLALGAATPYLATKLNDYLQTGE